jgi:hypothetical protein
MLWNAVNTGVSEISAFKKRRLGNVTSGKSEGWKQGNIEH